jgi:hypothetical protein
MFGKEHNPANTEFQVAMLTQIKNTFKITCKYHRLQELFTANIIISVLYELHLYAFTHRQTWYIYNTNDREEMFTWISKVMKFSCTVSEVLAKLQATVL